MLRGLNGKAPCTRLRFRVKPVCKHDGTPTAQMLARAVDKDLCYEKALGEVSTDQDGRYEIAYSAEQFRQAEKKPEKHM